MRSIKLDCLFLFLYLVVSSFFIYLGHKHFEDKNTLKSEHKETFEQPPELFFDDYFFINYFTLPDYTYFTDLWEVEYEDDFKCLSLIVNKEIGGGSSIEKQAVAQVVMNRVIKNDSSVCSEMVSVNNGVYQFSWVRNIDTIKGIDNSTLEDYIHEIGTIYTLDYSLKKVGNSEFFKKCGNSSKWWKTLKFKAKVGEHCFYEQRNIKKSTKST